MELHLLFFCILNLMPHEIIDLTELFTSQQVPPADASLTSRGKKLSGSNVAVLLGFFAYCADEESRVAFIIESSLNFLHQHSLVSASPPPTQEHHLTGSLFFQQFFFLLLVSDFVPDSNTLICTVNFFLGRKNKCQLS